jgi:hypothetical protein
MVTERSHHRGGFPDAKLRAPGRQAGRARQGRRRARRHLQLNTAGNQALCCRKGRQALKLPGAVRGPGMPAADFLHRSRTGAAGDNSLADTTKGREEVCLPSADHIFPRVMNKKVREPVMRRAARSFDRGKAWRSGADGAGPTSRPHEHCSSPRSAKASLPLSRASGRSIRRNACKACTLALPQQPDRALFGL